MKNKAILTIKIRVFKLTGGGKHIAVKTLINGHKAILLIDTGASNSIFDAGHIAFANSELKSVKSDGSGSGFNSEITDIIAGDNRRIKNFAI
jgi:hypothetical protein